MIRFWWADRFTWPVVGVNLRQPLLSGPTKHRQAIALLKALLRGPQIPRCPGEHEGKQVSGVEIKGKQKQKDVGKMKGGRTGDSRIMRNSLM